MVKSCFVISPIGEPETETRKRSDQVLKHIVRPAVEYCGYRATRADEIDAPGLITSQVIQRVVYDDLVVADLTERNPNVFYELAIRHAIRKPLVQIIRKGDQIPFDVANTRTIQVDHRDLDNADLARQEIINQIKALEREPEKLETPISISLEIQLLRQSDNPEARTFAQIFEMISELKSNLDGALAPTSVKAEIERLRRDNYDMLARVLEEFRRAKVKGWDFEDVMNIVHETSGRRGDPTGILSVAGFFRDEAPWLYELGLEAYRSVMLGNRDEADEALMQFVDTIKSSREKGLVRHLKIDNNKIDELEYIFDVVVIKRFGPGKTA